eukprot:2819975-Amphidinium_carterae.2
MGQAKRRRERQAAAKAQAQGREMSLPRVSETEVMKVDIGIPPSVGAATSYDAVTSGTASAAAASGWGWQAEARSDGKADPRVKAQPGRGD